MENSWRDRAIALAGVTQAAALVDQLAKTGYLESRGFETSVHSLLELSPPTTEAVFNGADRLEKGLEVLADILQNQRVQERNNQLLNYCLGIFHLQRRLSKNRKMQDEIGRRLTQARHQVEHFGISHDNVIANLADIYTGTISTFQYRIQVVGEYQYLQQARVANQVRVLLFAAIRAAMLWRQVGGNRWQLLLQRGTLLNHTQTLLSEVRAGA